MPPGHPGYRDGRRPHLGTCGRGPSGSPGARHPRRGLGAHPVRSHSTRTGSFVSEVQVAGPPAARPVSALRERRLSGALSMQLVARRGMLNTPVFMDSKLVFFPMNC